MARKLKIGNLTAKIPVVQGGMGVGVSLSSLAGAVAAAGGIGVISTAQIGFRHPDFARNPIECNLIAVKEEIRKAREKAMGGILGVNIMVVTRRYEDYVKAAVEAGIDLIISGAGLPMKLPELVAGSLTKIAPIVSGRKALEVIVRYWTKKYHRLPDLVVVEGPKAGGHLGFSREELDRYETASYDGEVVQILDYVKQIRREYRQPIPVVVGGGVFNREDMDHYLALGADGVQMATRFVTTEECDAAPGFKEAYLAATKEDVRIINSPVGLPGRAIANPFLEKVKEGCGTRVACRQCITTCNPATTPYCITEALIRAVEGDTENGLIFCGSNVAKCCRLETVAEIMEEFQ